MSQVSQSTTASVKGKEESEKAQKTSNDGVIPTVASQGETSISCQGPGMCLKRVKNKLCQLGIVVSNLLNWLPLC